MIKAVAWSGVTCTVGPQRQLHHPPPTRSAAVAATHLHYEEAARPSGRVDAQGAHRAGLSAWTVARPRSVAQSEFLQPAPSDLKHCLVTLCLTGCSLRRLHGLANAVEGDEGKFASKLLDDASHLAFLRSLI